MSFTISQKQPDGRYFAVQMGLSSGEVRQALLDRIREDIRSGSFATTMQHIRYLKHVLKCKHEEHERITISDMLYEHMTDDELDNLVWQFQSENIKVEKNN